MKKIIPFLLLFSLSAFGQYNSDKISLLSRYDDTTVVATTNSVHLRYSSVWGYFDSTTHKEYAIIGSSKGTHFLDVTAPSAPVPVSYMAGARANCTWREYKTRGKYLYAVSDDPSPNSLQIFDLGNMPVVNKVYDSDSIFSRAHTVFVDKDKLYCGSVTTNNGIYYSMAVYSLTNPLKPKFLRSLNQDFSNITTVHDMFVRNDTVYASCGNQGLYVLKLQGDSMFTMLGSLTSYPDKGYNHSSVLTPDGKTLIFCDEVPASLKIKIVDVSNLIDIKVLSTFESGMGGTPHNPFLMGKSNLVVSYYKDGVQIFDISIPTWVRKKGFFDSYPDNDTLYPAHSVYAGCWGVYTELPSGILLASDIQRGLFILNPGNALGVVNKAYSEDIQVYPNPFIDRINIKLRNSKADRIEIFNVQGQSVAKLKPDSDSEILLPEIPRGIYILKISENGREHFCRMIH